MTVRIGADMKRTEVNRIIREAIHFVNERGLCLPGFATWGLSEWGNLSTSRKEIIDNMLGWDITDFGSGEFEKTGLLIFTFRNGNFYKKDEYPKPYAEKLLLVGDGQELPYHFHWKKIEDIINRGGGNLIIQLYNSDEKEEFSSSPVEVSMDGEKVIVEAGGTVTLKPGQSITLMPGQYHRWIGEKGTGPVMLFEVSSTNDDTIDNRFYNAQERLPNILEDVQPEYLLFKDYAAYVRFKGN